jgi:hypothetical protein
MIFPRLSYYGLPARVVYHLQLLRLDLTSLKFRYDACSVNADIAAR